MRSVTIKISYPGSVISVNHYKYRGGIHTKPEAKAFMEELGWKIKASHLEDWRLPLAVKVDGVFRDKRSTPDLSNLGKVCLDSIEEATGINDRDFRWQDGIVTVDKSKEPYLLITITEEKER